MTNNVTYKKKSMISLPILSSILVKSTCHLVGRSAFISFTGFSDFIAYYYTTSKDDGDKIENKSINLPEEPQNCCMSGCANCVWIAYAEELAKILNDGGETAKQKIMEHVKDPNLRAFLMLELRHLFKEKK